LGLRLAHYIPQREGGVAGGQQTGRDLVEQRLELRVVVLVDQRDSGVWAGHQLAGTVQSGEPTPDSEPSVFATRSWIRASDLNSGAITLSAAVANVRSGPRNR
jgi:hypothetical protein